MNVTFTRTSERRYRVSVEGPGIISSYMEPAPGYDSRLPHDMAHFVVENELGIAGGVFGQLAAGGHASTFRPVGGRPRGRVVRRGERIATASRDDAMFSEKVVTLACRVWNTGSSGAMLTGPGIEGLTPDDLRRVCLGFDAVSAVWSQLPVGGSMTLTWRGSAGQRTRGRTRRGRA